MGWVLRNRSETAFLAPDADPEKGFFTYMTNDAVAKFYGNWGSLPNAAYQSDPPLPGSSQNMWQFASAQGNPQAGAGGNNPPVATFLTVGPLHFLNSDGNVVAYAQGGATNPNTFGKGTDSSVYGSDAGGVEAWFMRSYQAYGISRARELGFNAAGIQHWIMEANEGIILDSGYPELAAIFDVPTTSISSLTWYQTWAELVAKEGFQSRFLNNIPYQASPGVHPNFVGQTSTSNTDGAAVTGVLAMNADAGFATSRGSQAWAWIYPRAWPGIIKDPLDLSRYDPLWGIIPRTDTYAVPAIPTTAH